MNYRLSYIPIPVVHVLREGKKYLVDSKELIVGDIVHLDSKISGIIPADIILF
jgi:magnesium-transporting ATPase (P-type)